MKQFTFWFIAACVVGLFVNDQANAETYSGKATGYLNCDDDGQNKATHQITITRDGEDLDINIPDIAQEATIADPYGKRLSGFTDSYWFILTPSTSKESKIEGFIMAWPENNPACTEMIRVSLQKTGE